MLRVDGRRKLLCGACSSPMEKNLMDDYFCYFGGIPLGFRLYGTCIKPKGHQSTSLSFPQLPEEGTSLSQLLLVCAPPESCRGLSQTPQHSQKPAKKTLANIQPKADSIDDLARS